MPSLRPPNYTRLPTSDIIICNQQKHLNIDTEEQIYFQESFVKDYDMAESSVTQLLNPSQNNDIEATRSNDQRSEPARDRDVGAAGSGDQRYKRLEIYLRVSAAVVVTIAAALCFVIDLHASTKFKCAHSSLAGILNQIYPVFFAGGITALYDQLWPTEFLENARIRCGILGAFYLVILLPALAAFGSKIAPLQC